MSESTIRRNPRGFDEIVAVLGGGAAVGGRARTAEALAERIREGLPFATVAAVMGRYDLSRDVLCKILNLSPRSFRRRREQMRLSPAESDRLYRLARVIAHANRVFEDPGESTEWIHTRNAALGKQQPVTLLDTDIGGQRVAEVLGRIEHGIVG